MRIVRGSLLALILITFMTAACRTKQEGTIEGSVSPPASSAMITVLQNGKEIVTVPVNAQDNKFRIALAAGTYSIRVTAPLAAYPFFMSDIVVKPGATTTLTVIELTLAKGAAVLSGKVLPLLRDADVMLIAEGQERAAVHTDSEGNYEIRELPAGTYEVRVKAPGRADDLLHVVASDGQRIVRNAVLFPITPSEGVDWTNGKIRAIGIGLQPHNAPTASVGREMAKRAALADAQRNLLRIIEQIRVHADQSIQAVMANPDTASRIQGFLQGYTVVNERNLEGGKVEIMLELPLNGRSGLTRAISE